MRRILLMLAVIALMAVMLVAMAVPAFAKNAKPEGGGEPLVSGNLETKVTQHCGPIFELFGTEDIHGAVPTVPNQSEGGNCVRAPKQ